MNQRLLKECGDLIGEPLESDLMLHRYECDSRAIGEGDLFFALKGARFEGESFLEEVAKKGAIGAVVSDSYKGCNFGLVLFRVPDVTQTLQDMARKALLQNPVRIIGVTGSVGKTTVKEFIATLLESSFRVGKSWGNRNTGVTIPLAILNRSGSEEILALEMGLVREGDLVELVEIAPPEVAVITQVALSHSEHFPEGLSGIARAKTKIASQPQTKAVIVDLALLEFKISPPFFGQLITFSLEDSSADYYLSSIKGRYCIDERGVRSFECDLPFSETPFLHDFLAALAVARYMGVSWKALEERCAHLQRLPGRFEKIERGGICLINDTYNANPASMKAALQHLPQPQEGGKRIAILGSMKELGLFSEDAHEEVGRFAQRYIDILICNGEETEALYRAFQEVKKPTYFIAELDTLVETLMSFISPGDVVLVKGSRSLQLERVVEAIEKEFVD